MGDFFGEQEDKNNSTVNSQASGGFGAADNTGFGANDNTGFGADDNTGFGGSENPALAASGGSHKSGGQPASHAASTQEDPFGVAPAAGSAAGSAAASPAASQQFNNTARSTSSTAAAEAVSSRPVVKSAEEAMRESEQRVVLRGKQKAEAEKKAIDARIKVIDEKNADGSTQLKKAAASHMQEEATKRQKAVTAAKQQHRQEQKAHEEHVAKLQRGGHLWEQVADVVDTSKSNKYAAKSTDRMRNLLTNLKAKPNAPQMHAAATTDGKGKERAPQLF